MAQKWTFSSPRLRFFIVILLVLGVFFRFYNLEQKVYWHDEVYTSLRSSGYTGSDVVQQVFDGRVINIPDLQKYQRPNSEKDLSDTINSLVQHPEHPPLYYLMARFWMQLFGELVKSPRGLSVLFSLLVLPCMYWLGLELFKSPLVGWVAVALIAVSPFHVLYAQEAREYSLWTVTLLLASVALLRAIRLKTKFNWGVYTLTLILGLYTSLFFALVCIAHGFYVVIIERLRFSKTVVAYLLASSTGLLGFTPWLFVFITGFERVQEKTAWTTVQEPYSFLVKLWGLHLSCSLVDLGFQIEHPFTYLVPPILLILVGYGLDFLYRHTPKEVWLFIFTSIGVTASALILPDLILGGRRSVSSRYFIPCYIGIQLAIAYLIATQISMASFAKQKLGRGLMVVITSLGIASCSVSSQANRWWNKSVSYDNPQIAQLVNQAPRPLVISDTSDINTGNIISLSYLLDPKVRLQLVAAPNIPTIPNGFSDVFVFNPSKNLRQRLENDYNTQLEPADPVSRVALWKLK